MTAKKNQNKKPETKLRNNVFMLLDDSGSMGSIARSALKTFNSIIETIKKESVEKNQETRIWVSTFGDRYDQIVMNQDAATAKPLVSYNPNQSCTKLFDSMFKMIAEMDYVDSLTRGQDSFLLMVVTDGQNNAGMNSASVVSLIAARQKTDRFTFAMQVPPGEKSHVVALGIPEGNVQEWETTSEGIAIAGECATKGIQNYYNLRSTGAKSVSTFYTDLSKVKAKDIKAKCEDVTSQVKSWQIEKEVAIREFIESKIKRPMLKGSCFYQLTKTEKNVQDYKKILVMEKGNKTVYGGDKARQLLGLPTTGDIRLVPGNHANFDIFVQSMSVNRKLVRGTRAIYWEAIGVPFTEGPSATYTRPSRPV